MALRIGWVSSVVGCFGAVREMVELSNALVRLGHNVTIYSDDNGKITWLPSLARQGTCKDALKAQDMDACILLCNWDKKTTDVWAATRPRLRSVSVMGFDPSRELAEILRGEVKTVAGDLRVMKAALMAPGVMALPDSSWQCDWLRVALGVDVGVPIGGVNLQQFKPTKPPVRHGAYRILATGDPRERKGSTVVKGAVERLNEMGIKTHLVTYWSKRIPQDKMAAWYSDGDVFCDAERRAGWCNPVAEAMACGTACVSTDIGAVRDFAINNETALLVPVDDEKAMADALATLYHDRELRRRLVANGLERIKRYSYDLIAPPLVAAIEERLKR